MIRLLHCMAMGAATLGLVSGWLIIAAVPATAVVNWDVTNPGPDALVEGPLDLAVVVDAAEGEQVQAVAIRFVRDGSPFGASGLLSYRAGPLTAGRSGWGSRLDPTRSWALGGQPMPNGLYDVQTQAKILTSAGEQWTEWRGHPIALQVPPPATISTLRSAGGGQIEVSWRQIQLPDFVRYDVERSADGVSWAVVASMASPDTTRLVDAPPPGMWRYRTRVVRSDGQGGQLTTVSAPAGIDGLPPHAPGGDSSQPAMVGAAAADDASGAVPLTRPPSPAAGSDTHLAPGAWKPPALTSPHPPSDTYHRTLPYPKTRQQAVRAEAAAEEREAGANAISVTPSPLHDRQLLLPVAGGLLLMILAAHVGLQLRR
jgi:hypothetical protein